MNKEVTYKGVVNDIVETSASYTTTGSVLVEQYSVGVVVDIGGTKRTVPLVKFDRSITPEDLINMEYILKTDYGIEKCKEFTFIIPDNKNLNDQIKTTGYKQKVSGNVDNLLIFTSITLFNNRVREALIDQSRMLKENIHLR